MTERMDKPENDEYRASLERLEIERHLEAISRIRQREREQVKERAGEEARPPHIEGKAHEA